MVACISGNIVTPTHIVRQGTLVVSEQKIEEIRTTLEEESSDLCPDISSRWILPGFIDTHGDALETEIMPRTNGGLFPVDMALLELEKKLVSSGITTMYHALSADENEAKQALRNRRMMENIMEIMQELFRERSLIRHRLHIRYEITHLEAVSFIEQFISGKRIHQLSFNDHTPGQGQFRDLEVYRSYLKKRLQSTDEMVQQQLKKDMSKEKISYEALKRLSDMAGRNGIPISSHDDDSADKVRLMKQLNTVICEFPITMEAAQEAKRLGMYVVMGAPNVVLGRSHSNNLSAIEAIQAGVVDILCSDYSPSSLMQAVFTLYHSGLDLCSAVNLVSVKPAEALGISDSTGSLEAGKQADFLVVDLRDRRPLLREVWVKGRRVAMFDYP